MAPLEAFGVSAEYVCKVCVCVCVYGLCCDCAALVLFFVLLLLQSVSTCLLLILCSRHGAPRIFMSMRHWESLGDGVLAWADVNWRCDACNTTVVSVRASTFKAPKRLHTNI